jgi:hypothetical protein
MSIRLPEDINDDLSSFLTSPIFIFTDALVSFFATIFASYALAPIGTKSTFRLLSVSCNFIHSFISGPFAEASIRKRDFQAAETKGVWLLLKKIKGRVGRKTKGDWVRKLWVALCIVLAFDNLYGFIRSFTAMYIHSSLLVNLANSMVKGVEVGRRVNP